MLISKEKLIKASPLLLVSLTGNLFVILILWTPLTGLLVQPLIVNEPLQKSEVAVIFASGWVNETTMDYDALLRMQRGVELYRQGWVRKIVCLGGTTLPHRDSREKVAEVMAKIIVSWGVPPENVLAHAEATNTYDDLRSMFTLLRHQIDFNRTIYVSSAYHTARIRWFLNSMGINGIVVHAYPVEKEPLHFGQRMFYFRSIAREYLAHVYYRLMPTSPVAIWK
ncbi:MAG: YdcF family protein [Magnetococcus sp. DMHC-1]